METIPEDIDSRLEEMAIESLQMIDPICEECYEEGEDDPLGMITGVNTPYNKKINKFAEEMADGQDQTIISEYRTQLVEKFYEYRRENREKVRMVDNELKCSYCFEEKRSPTNDEDVPLRIRDEGDSDLFGKDEDDWR